jgi:hypothetical protein
MIQFKPGDKVRVNEGLLEGQTGVVADTRENTTLVHLEDTAFGGGVLAFFTETLVPAEDPHPALTTVKLYPDLTKGGYMFRVTTFVDGIMYQSLPMTGPMLLDLLLKNPPAGLESVECRMNRGDTPQGVSWKLLWSDS